MSAIGFIWIIAAVIFGVIEAATVSLVTIWFAIGAVAAAVAAQLGLNLVWQIGIFVVVSAVFLCFTRPIFKRITVKKPQRTNADRFIGMEAMVISAIDKINNNGQVRIAGSVWSAASADGSEIAEGSRVKVVEIRGVRLIVEPI